MNLLGALAIIAALVVVSTIAGIVLRARAGRVRVSTRPGDQLTNADVGSSDAFGTRATLLQFSTEYCAPCRAANRVLGAAAARSEGVVHLDIDLTERPDLASRFSILSTPTTLILNGSGSPVARITGAPRPAELDRQLAQALGEPLVNAD